MYINTHFLYWRTGCGVCSVSLSLSLSLALCLECVSLYTYSYIRTYPHILGYAVCLYPYLLPYVLNVCLYIHIHIYAHTLIYWGARCVSISFSCLECVSLYKYSYKLTYPYI